MPSSHNRGRQTGLSDGIVITPLHNPPDSGGIKYNPPNGGPADTDITRKIADRANALLRENNRGVRRLSYNKARTTNNVREHDFITPYVNDLKNILDMDRIKSSGLRLGADALGGAGLAYWQPIAENLRAGH